MTERVTDDMIRDWRIHYGLDERSPREAMLWWLDKMNGAPAGAVAALGTCLIEIEALQDEIQQLKTDRLELFREMLSIAQAGREAMRPTK